MPIKDFCDNFLIECLNKIDLPDNTWILMGDFNIDLRTLHANNATSCFFAVNMQQHTRVVGLSTTLINNIFMNSVKLVTGSDNILCQLADHLLQFLVLKDFRVSNKPKHDQIFERNYGFFNNNEFKNEIIQIDWKILFDIPDIILCFQKFLHTLAGVSDDHETIKKLSKK